MRKLEALWFMPVVVMGALLMLAAAPQPGGLLPQELPFLGASRTFGNLETDFRSAIIEAGPCRRPLGSDAPDENQSHHVYVSGGNSDLLFEGVRLIGGHSWSFQVSPWSSNPTRGVTVRDVILDNVDGGLEAGDGASDVTFDGVRETARGTAFCVQNNGYGGARNIVFSNFSLQAKHLFSSVASSSAPVGAGLHPQRLLQRWRSAEE